MLVCACFTLATRASAAATAASGPGGAVETPSPAEIEEVLPKGKELSGHEIYDRLFKNRKRLRTAIQTGRILSRTRPETRRRLASSCAPRTTGRRRRADRRRLREGA
jgi:hypothetical protein